MIGIGMWELAICGGGLVLVVGVTVAVVLVAGGRGPRDGET
jgi:hypothetical protein